MLINVEEIKLLSIKMKKIRDNYEDICINYYGNLNSIKEYWKSNKSDSYFNVVNSEKKYYFELLNNIDDLLDIFKYLINKYNSIGNIIRYDFSLEDSYLQKKISIIDSLNDILNIYNNLNIKKINSSILNLITKEKDILLNGLKFLEEYCDANRNTMNEIVSVENDLREKFSKLDVITISVSDFKDYIFNNKEKHDEIVVDEGKIKTICSKLEFHLSEEQKLINDLNDIFIEMSDYYKSDNIDRVERIECEIILAMNNIRKNKMLNYQMLVKEITNIIQTRQDVKNILDGFSSNVYDNVDKLEGTDV